LSKFLDMAKITLIPMEMLVH
jgi:hypothetical protein